MPDGLQVASLYGVLDLEDNFTPGLAKAQQGVTALGGSVGGLNGLVKGLGGLLGSLSVAALFTDAIDQSSKYQDATAQLDAVLKSTTTRATDGLKDMAAATNFSRDALLQFAQAAQQTTKFSNDMVIGAQSMLLTFTKVGSDVFPQAITAAMDLSQAMGQDLKSSVVQIGKALDDPVHGFSALHRVGVDFSELQQQQIKQFVAQNNLMGAQKIILGELSTEFGGSSAAAGKTFSGAMDILSHSANDLLRNIGSGLLPGLTALSQVFNSLFTSLDSLNPGFLTLVSTLGALALGFNPLMAVFAALGGPALVPLLAMVGAVAAVGLAFQTNFGGIRDIVNKVVSDITPTLNVFKGFIQDIQDVFNPTTGPQDGNAGKMAKMDGNDQFEQIKPELRSKFRQIADDVLPAITDFIGQLATQFVTGLSDLIPQVLESLGNFLSSVMSFLKNDGARVFSEGIQALFTIGGSVIGFVRDAGDKLMRGIGDFLAPTIQWLQTDGAALLGQALDTALSLGGQLLSGISSALPGIIAWLGGLFDGAVSWLGSTGKTLLQNGLQAALQLGDQVWQGLSNAAPKIAAAIGTAIQGGIDWINNTGIPLLRTALKNLLGIDIGDIKIPSLQAIGDAISGAWTKVLYPAIQGLLKNIATFWKDTLQPALGELSANFPSLDKIAATVASFWNDTLQPPLNKLAGLITDFWNETLKPAVDKLINGIQGFVNNLNGADLSGLATTLAVLGAGLAIFLGVIGSGAAGLLGGIGDALPKFGSGIKDLLDALSTAAKGDLFGGLSKLGKGLQDLGVGIGSIVIDTAASIAKFLLDLAGVDPDKARAAVDAVTDSLKNGLEGALEAVVPNLKTMLDAIKLLQGTSGGTPQGPTSGPGSPDDPIRDPAGLTSKWTPGGSKPAGGSSNEASHVAGGGGDMFGIQAALTTDITWLKGEGLSKATKAISELIAGLVSAVQASGVSQLGGLIQDSVQTALDWLSSDGASLAFKGATTIVQAMNPVFAAAGAALVQSVRQALLDIAGMFGALPGGAGTGVQGVIIAAAGAGRTFKAGGFTGSGGNNEIVGGVHANEFVVPENGALVVRGGDSNGGGAVHIQTVHVYGVQNPADMLKQIKKQAGLSNQTVTRAI